MKSNLFYAMVLCSVIGAAQTTKNVENGLFKVNALAPGVSYELGVGVNATLNFDFLIGIEIEGGSRRSTSVELFPAVGAEYRYFHNLNKRRAANKNIAGNSGNYFGGISRLLVRAPLLGNLEYDEPISYHTALFYGIQRTYSKGFYFSVQAGPGLFFNDDVNAGLFLSGKLGWILRKRK